MNELYVATQSHLDRHCPGTWAGPNVGEPDCETDGLADIVDGLIERLGYAGLGIAVFTDATAGPRHPEWSEGYAAAMINYRFLAHAVLRTADVTRAMCC